MLNAYLDQNGTLRKFQKNAPTPEKKKKKEEAKQYETNKK